MLYSYAECTCLLTIWLNQIFPTINLTLTTYLGHNCIVFENFISSVGDLRVYSNAILSIKMCSCISLSLKSAKIKIPGNIVIRLWHINNVMSYEDFHYITIFLAKGIWKVHIFQHLFVCFQTSVYTLREFHKNRDNRCQSVSIVDLTVADICFTGSASRRQ